MTHVRCLEHPNIIFCFPTLRYAIILFSGNRTYLPIINRCVGTYYVINPKSYDNLFVRMSVDRVSDTSAK